MIKDIGNLVVAGEQEGWVRNVKLQSIFPSTTKPVMHLARGASKYCIQERVVLLALVSYEAKEESGEWLFHNELAFIAFSETDRKFYLGLQQSLFFIGVFKKKLSFEEIETEIDIIRMCIEETVIKDESPEHV